MIPSIVVIRQRRRWARRRGGSCRRAALALSPAAEGLLAFGPALLPVREARVAVVWAWSGHGCRGRWGRRGRRGRGGGGGGGGGGWHGRAANVVMSAAPDL